MGLAFTPDGKKLLAGTEGDGKIRVWDVATGKIQNTLDGRLFLGRSIALSPDGKRVALGAVGHTVRLWDVATGNELFTEYQGHDSQISSLVFTRDGKTLVSGADHGRTFIWNTTSRKPIGVLSANAVAMSLSPDGKRLATVANNASRVRIWNMDTANEAMVIGIPSPKNLKALMPDAKDFKAAIFSHDGRTLFTLDWDRNRRDWYDIRHWDLATGKQERSWSIPYHQTYGLMVAGDGKTTFARVHQSTVSIYNAESGQEKLLRGQENVNRIAISPDARLLACEVLGQSPAIRLNEVVTGKEINLLKREQGDVGAIAWSPDARLVASGNHSAFPNRAVANQTVQVWDAATGKELAQFGGFKADVMALTFTPDGKSLAAGLSDSTMLIWDMEKVRSKAGPRRKLGTDGLQSLWFDLVADNASKAHQAIWVMVGAADDFLPFIRDRLRPVAIVDASNVRQWVTDLDNDKFAVRQAAAKELEKAGEQVRSFIQDAFKGNVTLETRRRLEQILQNLSDTPGPETVRTIRAIMALERIGSPDAQAALQSLARGAPRARETDEAKASLERLAQRALKVP